MDRPQFEIDLLDFQGEPLEFDFETPGASAPWLLEEVEAPLKIDDDIAFRAELDATLTGTTVHIDGHIDGTFYYKCGRCLEWREFELDEPVDFVLMSRTSWDESYGGEDEIVLCEADLDVSFYEDEVIDLRPLLREAVLLALPEFPMCPDSLSEACDTAYERVIGEETIEENESNSMDLRWSKLKEIDLENDS